MSFSIFLRINELIEVEFISNPSSQEMTLVKTILIFCAVLSIFLTAFHYSDLSVDPPQILIKHYTFGNVPYWMFATFSPQEVKEDKSHALFLSFYTSTSFIMGCKNMFVIDAFNCSEYPSCVAQPTEKKHVQLPYLEFDGYPVSVDVDTLGNAHMDLHPWNAIYAENCTGNYPLAATGMFGLGADGQVFKSLLSPKFSL